ncbi:MAG: hypothetical protein IPK57_02515 [Chitinophagaceae bacterium]|nr:hypothetical protein [Chitinophagaceae bacterium]
MLKQFNDEFVTTEHLLLAIVQGNDSTAKLLKNTGLTEKGLIAAIKDLRKGGDGYITNTIPGIQCAE